MPSGKAHDRITVVTAVLSYPVWWLAAPNRDLTEYAVGVAAYLFSGFYLSGDLDTRSVALKRWGVLKFLWYPYQRVVPHRSWVSHGIGVGPILRVIYFIAAIWVVARCALWVVDQWILPVNRDALILSFAEWLAKMIWHHPAWAAWGLWGLVLGGIAHTVADSSVSRVKKLW